MEKKSNKGLIFLIVFQFIIILGLGGFIVYDRFFSNPVSSKETNSTKKVEKKVSYLEDESKPLVYDDENYKYLKIPYINIKGSVGADINNDIKNFISDYEDTKEAPEYNMISYKTYTNDNITSIIITKSTPGSSKYYKAININSKNGTEVSNEEILKIKNIEEKVFSKKLFAAYEKEQSDYGNLDTVRTQHIYGDEYTSVYDGTKINIEGTKIEDFDLYLNENKELCAVADVYLIAGPERNFYIYNLDTNSREK